MARRKRQEVDEEYLPQPALIPEEREQQCIGLAINLAEQQLRDGTASSQTINFFLSRSTREAKLKEELAATQVELNKAKTENLQRAKESDKLYAEALEAFKSYVGSV